LKAPGEYTTEEWEALKNSFERCPRCEIAWANIEPPPGRVSVVTADHIVPLSRGGTNYIDNIQPLCFRCNSKKGAKVQRLSLTEIIEASRNAWCAETAYEPARWSANNPALGQCAVTAVKVQLILGGEIRRQVCPDESTHYYNVIDDQITDLTASQFDVPPLYGSNDKVVTTFALLNNPDTEFRFRRFSAQFDRWAYHRE
jgi:hypothetical protein